MEAERSVAKGWTNEPPADLAHRSVGNEAYGFQLCQGPNGRSRRKIGDCTLAGEDRNDGHEHEDFDQSRARKRHLLKERQGSQRGPVEWQGAAGQQQDGGIGRHPEGDGDLNSRLEGGATEPGAQRSTPRLGDVHPCMSRRRTRACGSDRALGLSRCSISSTVWACCGALTGLLGFIFLVLMRNSMGRPRRSSGRAVNR